MFPTPISRFQVLNVHLVDVYGNFIKQFPSGINTGFWIFEYLNLLICGPKKTLIWMKEASCRLNKQNLLIRAIAKTLGGVTGELSDTKSLEKHGRQVKNTFGGGRCIIVNVYNQGKIKRLFHECKFRGFTPRNSPCSTNNICFDIRSP